MATPPQPHADLDNSYLAKALEMNRRIARIVERIQTEQPTISQLTQYLLDIVLAVNTQQDALHRMDIIRQQHSRRGQRNNSDS